VSTVQEVLAFTLRQFDLLVLVYFVAVNAFTALLLTAATLNLRRFVLADRDEPRSRLLGSDVAPRISVLAPAYNEEATVAQSVTALLTLRYPRLEVVVVNDGSPDGTLDALRAAFQLEPVPVVFRSRTRTAPVRGVYRSATTPNLVVVDKENGGKADALNAGLDLCSGDLVCAIDADTLVEPDALLRMVRPFLSSTDMLAAGGTIRVVNDSVVRHGRVVQARTPRSYLAGVQTVEYLRAFLFGRLGWNSLGGNLVVSGAFGLFDREAVLQAGGYLHGTVGEDLELVARLRATAGRGSRHRVHFVPDPVAWTEVPESLRVLGRQRDRWHRGLTDVLRRYRRSILNPRKGALGLVVYPYFLFVELLAPAIEAVGLVGFAVGLAFDAVRPEFAVAFFLLAYGFSTLLSAYAVLVDQITFPRGARRRDVALLLLWALLEPLGYRQLTVYWRLRGLVRQLRGNTQDWGVMTRRGFAGPGEPPDDRPIAQAV
jgi:cellulose synthase/poly-beta-1,6-N-acetylglucosamine synthase-like glycosyltransferase